MEIIIKDNKDGTYEHNGIIYNDKEDVLTSMLFLYDDIKVIMFV